VAHHEALGDRDAIRRTIATSVGMLLVPALLALLGGLILVAVFPALFNLGAAQTDAARIICVVFAFDLAVSIPSDTFGATLAGLQRFDVVNATLIATTLAQGLGWFVVIRLGGGLVALATVTVAISLGGQLARVLVASRLVGNVTLTRRRFDRGMVKPLAGASVWFFVADLADVVVSRIDIVVVGLVVGVPEAAVYAVALKLSLLADRAYRPATTSFFPQSAALSAQAGGSVLQPVVMTGTRISLGVAWPLCITLILLAAPALEAWVGDDFSSGAPVVVFLAAAVAVKALTRTGVLALQGMGNVRYPAIVNAVEAALNLILSISLGSTFGIQGIALATLVAAAITDLGIMLPHLCRKLGLSLWSFLLSVLKSHLPPVAAAVVAGLPIRDHVRGIPAVLAGAAAICGIYLIVFACVGVDAEERRRVKGMLGINRAGQRSGRISR